MTDTTQPTQPFPALQEGIDDAKLVINDEAVKTALAKPSITNVFTAAQEPEVRELAAVVPEVFKESKAGYKTTEFWVAAASVVALNLNGVVMTLPDKYQAIGTVVVAGLYALSRGLAKHGIPDVEPSAVAVAPADEVVQRTEA